MRKILLILLSILLLSSCTSTTKKECTKTIIGGEIPCSWSIWNAGEVVSFDYNYFESHWFDSPTFRIDDQSLSPNSDLISIYFVSPPEDLSRIMELIPKELGVKSSVSKISLEGIDADVLTTFKGQGDPWTMDQTILFTTNGGNLGIILKIVPSIEKLDENRRVSIQNFLSSLSPNDIR